VLRAASVTAVVSVSVNWDPLHWMLDSRVRAAFDAVGSKLGPLVWTMTGRGAWAPLTASLTTDAAAGSTPAEAARLRQTLLATFQFPCSAFGLHQLQHLHLK
jgi:hypothetical protein